MACFFTLKSRGGTFLNILLLILQWVSRAGVPVPDGCQFRITIFAQTDFSEGSVFLLTISHEVHSKFGKNNDKNFDNESDL
jgi:hypothetical protein